MPRISSLSPTETVDLSQKLLKVLRESPRLSHASSNVFFDHTQNGYIECVECGIFQVEI